MGSLRVTCHPAEVASLTLTPAVVTAGTQFIHQLRMKGRLDLRKGIKPVKIVPLISTGFSKQNVVNGPKEQANY